MKVGVSTRGLALVIGFTHANRVVSDFERAGINVVKQFDIASCYVVP